MRRCSNKRRRTPAPRGVRGPLSRGAANGCGPAPGLLASVYSEVQTSRLLHALPLLSVLHSSFSVVNGPTSSATGNPGGSIDLFADEIAKLFPNLFGQPSAMLVPAAEPAPTRPLKVGVVLSGGQAPGSHNVICGIFGNKEYLMQLLVQTSSAWTIPRVQCQLVSLTM